MAFIKAKDFLSFGIENTEGLYIGKTEAEGENKKGQGLREYYEDYLGIDNEFINGKFIFTGRKGVGKSAFVKYLCNAAEDNPDDIYVSVVRNDKIDYEKILQSVPDEVGNKDQLIFEWIVLTKFVQLIIAHGQGKYTKEFEALTKFEEKNSGIASVDKWMTMEENRRNGWTVNFSELLKAFPLAFSKEFNRSSMRAPFYALIPALRNIIVKMLGFDVCKDVNFIIVFDDLDIHFEMSNIDHKKRLMELIRVAKNYNTDYLPKQEQRVLLMLRDDIARQLDGIAPDKNKIFSSYEYNLNWYKSDTGLSVEQSKLRQFINKRILIAFQKKGISCDTTDPWKSLVNDNPCYEYKNKTAFKYILDHTFYRPRDLVAFFDELDKTSFRLPMSPADVKQRLKKYFSWSLVEISDELSNTFTSDEIKLILKLFETMAENYKTEYLVIQDFIKTHNLPESTFDTLFEYNLIIPKDDQDYQYFSYRERPFISHKERYSYCLPQCIYKHYNSKA